MLQNSLRKLLVVDDEPLVRQTLSLCLQDDYEVMAVASGEEAIDASLKETYPVVILDLCMEGISGIETLKRLKKIQDLQNVIILTAYQSMESAISALNHGAFNYLTKPFDRRHLKSVISRGFEAYDQHALRKLEMHQRLMNVHDSFFSLLCHEFNTPLNIILGFSDLLAQGVQNQEHASWSEEIQRAGEHLHDVLMEIVDYIGASHLANSGVRDEFVPRKLFSTLPRNFEDRAISLVIEETEVLTRQLRGPSGAISMVARKLVSMASHQSHDVVLTIEMESGSEDESMLVLKVSGTGIRGDVLGERKIEHLFEPYQFMSDSGGSQRASLGLELATCRRIAEYANGSVDCFFSPSGKLGLLAKIPVFAMR